VRNYLESAGALSDYRDCKAVLRLYHCMEVCYFSSVPHPAVQLTMDSDVSILGNRSSSPKDRADLIKIGETRLISWTASLVSIRRPA
jgi:hypothetical protein